MSIFQEPALYQLFENHIFDALNILRTENQINETMILEEKNQIRDDIWFTILNHFETFQELESFKAIENWLKKNPWFENHFENFIGFGTISWSIRLNKVLSDMVYAHILKVGLIPNKKEIQKAYSEFEEFLVSKNILYNVNIHLSGLKHEGVIEIEPNLQIHGLNEREQYKYNKKLNYYDPHVTVLIVYETKFPKIFHHKPLDSKEQLRVVNEYRNLGLELIKALRIFKAGKFGATKIIENSPFLKNHHSQLRGFGIEKDEYELKDNEFVLDQRQIEEFKIFWKKYKEVKKEKTARFVFHAIERFMDIYERHNKVDPVIDLIIAAEVLLSNKQTYSEARRKKIPASEILSIRIALFLEPENEKEMKKIYKFMKVAYELRNDIVHGGDEVDFVLYGKKIQFWDIEEMLEEVLRKCFKKFINSFSETKFTKEQIIENLNKFTKTQTNDLRKNNL